MARYWFNYQPGGSGTPPTLNPANYLLATGKPQDFCTGAGAVCAVYSYKTNQSRPIPFGSNLQSYISSAGTFAQPTDVGAKVFVYVRNT